MAIRKLKVGDTATITCLDHISWKRCYRDVAEKETPVYLKTTGEVIFIGKKYLTQLCCEVKGISTPDCDGYDVVLSCIEDVKIWKESKRK